MTTKASMRREQFLDRPLPSSEESERIILGAIIQDNDLISTAIDGLQLDDFYSPLHRRVFRGMSELYQASKPQDPILIGEELKKDGSIESIGGVAAIVNLEYGLPHLRNIDKYIGIVREKSDRRKLIRACNQITSEALEEEEELSVVLRSAEKQFFELTRSASTTDEVQSNQELFEERLAASQNFDARNLVPTQLVDLNRTISGGFGRGNLIIIGARPSEGKTALSVGITQHAASLGKRAAFFSLEMSRKEVADRMIASEARVNLQDFRTNQLIPYDRERATKAAREVSALPFTIDDDTAITPLRLKSKCRRLIARYGVLDLVIVDYLQLMQCDSKARDRRLEIEEISRSLKLIAKELDVPVIALSQLSRAPEARKGGRPVLSDLRESGSIEQDADIVLLLHRESKDAAEAEIIVAKHRNGPTGIVKTLFLRSSATFENLAQEETFGYGR